MQPDPLKLNPEASTPDSKSAAQPAHVQGSFVSPLDRQALQQEQSLAGARTTDFSSRPAAYAAYLPQDAQARETFLRGSYGAALYDRALACLTKAGPDCAVLIEDPGVMQHFSRLEQLINQQTQPQNLNAANLRDLLAAELPPKICYRGVSVNEEMARTIFNNGQALPLKLSAEQVAEKAQNGVFSSYRDLIVAQTQNVGSAAMHCVQSVTQHPDVAIAAGNTFSEFMGADPAKIPPGLAALVKDAKSKDKVLLFELELPAIDVITPRAGDWNVAGQIKYDQRYYRLQLDGQKCAEGQEYYRPMSDAFESFVLGGIGEAQIRRVFLLDREVCGASPGFPRSDEGNYELLKDLWVPLSAAIEGRIATNNPPETMQLLSESVPLYERSPGQPPDLLPVELFDNFE